MASLTTLFVVGPNEYVEFNETWGSKAFLHHIWDQAQTPLQQHDVAPGQLHSAGARISKSHPPRIEFPVIVRLKGKGSTYRATGKWITWDDLAQRNPLAVRPPPSLDDFIAAGAAVGTAPKLRPGELASKNDPIYRIKSASTKSTTAPTMTKAQTPIMDLETDEDGWIGGSSQSIYARPSENATQTSPPPAPKHASKPSPVTPGRETSHTVEGANSSSLLQRMEMPHNFQTPPPKPRDAPVDHNRSPRPPSTPSPSSNMGASTSPFRTTPSQGIRRPGAKIPSPLPLTSPARNNGPISPLNTRTPLSASHPIPETPLKLSQRGGPQTPATPHYPTHPQVSHGQEADAARASGLGLGLTPLKSSVPLAPSPETLRSPLNEALHLRGRAASNASVGSPLKAGRSDLQGEPLALGSSASNSRASNSQVDTMLDRLRNTRSGLGTSASMWAPKSASTTEGAASTSSASTTTHTIGSGFTSSNLLGVQMGLDRKRPSHRPNGLQLSLGQEISVMQELEEKAEEDSAPSTLSSAAPGETFRIDPPDHESEQANQDGWQGHVVPPTPAMGCDSSSDDDDHAPAAKAPSCSLDAFGWGAEPRKASFFSKLPSSSTLEANWSGDDDDIRKDDIEMFEQMQSRAKASSKEKRNSSYGALPPPPINYAKPRTPSPTHPLLAKSPQLDGPAEDPCSTTGGLVSPSMGAPKFGSSSGATGGEAKSQQRLSPVSARSPLPVSEDSDGDADAEAEKPNRRRAAKKLDASAKQRGIHGEVGSKADKALHEEEAELEQKRSLKRDKSERIRGRRASQSKEKDIDKAKLSAAAPVSTAATVSLPASTLSKQSADDLVDAVENVSIAEEDKLCNVESTMDPTASSTAAAASAKRTPGSSRVQSIPAIKDDLFSSPVEPKVELPGTSTTDGKEAVSTRESLVEARAKEDLSPSPSAAQTPESNHQKTMSLDWAADDDELDDELPDLDDWGVTLNPAKSAPGASSEADHSGSTGAEKAARNGNGNGATSKAGDGGEKGWRRGGLSDAAHKGKKHGTGAEESSAKVKGAKGAKGKELFSRPRKGGSNGSNGANGAGGPLGIRIAGRAKEASLSPEPESAPTAAAQKKLPPPTSTPYGRWNKPTATAGAEEISIKGSSARKAGAAPPSGRPRIAADLGALAKLLTPAEEKGPPAKKGDKSSIPSSAPALEKAAEEKKGAKNKTSSEADSVHAPPSVGDSIHAPKNQAGNPSSTSAGAAVPTGPRSMAKKKSHAHHRGAKK